MSQEQLQAFREAVKADAALQERLQSASDAEAMVAIAGAAGFVIPLADMQRALAEISEDDLAGVSGGMFVTGASQFSTTTKLGAIARQPE